MVASRSIGLPYPKEYGTPCQKVAKDSLTVII